LLDGVLGALNELDHDDRRPEGRNIKRPESRIANRHRRHDWVQEAVIAVLECRGEPMQARDVHIAAEALLGESVRWGSVKACLAANVAGSSPRFVRVAPGRYAIGVLPATSGAPRRKHA
jgi:HB1, ASXL, restriction endonuclease HTH domain